MAEDRTTQRLTADESPTRPLEETPVLRRGSLLAEGRYRLERMLGRGGMAAVWLAHDEVLDREVAVKVLSDTLIDDREFLTRFEREARTAARLTHPNLLSIYDYGIERDRPFLVMEHAEGGDLGERLREGEALDPDRLAVELLGALRHIHDAGVLHRDVKPSNVLLDEHDGARLGDFGIARQSDATQLTETGLVLGTASYLAPEVMRGEPASESSDLYSLGVVLREVSRSRPASPELAALIEDLCRPGRDERPASADVALDQLERGPVRAPAPAAPLEPTEAIASQDRGPQPAERQGGRRRLAIAAALVAAALLAALAFAVLPGGDDAGEPEQAAREAEAEAEPEQPAEPVDEEPPPEEASAEPDGAALNDQGYALIQEGRYADAIPVLEQAVSVLEGSGGLTYAYALYNLGHALRMAGRPADAIPILEARLEIPNQQGTVRRELELAREQAGVADDDDNPERGRGRGQGDDDD